jgi:2-iminobutanoate/2-iminopropanoate deaminase
MKKVAFIIVPLIFLIMASDIVFNPPASAQSAEKAASAQAALPFSPAVRTAGLIFVSGHIGTDPQTGKLVGEDIVSQTRQTLENIDALLKKDYRSSLKGVVKTTVFLKSMDDYAEMNAVYASFFPGRKPARSTVEVSRLARGALIEIDAIVETTGFLPVKQ